MAPAEYAISNSSLGSQVSNTSSTVVQVPSNVTTYANIVFIYRFEQASAGAAFQLLLGLSTNSFNSTVAFLPVNPGGNIPFEGIIMASQGQWLNAPLGKDYPISEKLYVKNRIILISLNDPSFGPMPILLEGD